jgi:hypothetical protein
MRGIAGTVSLKQDLDPRTPGWASIFWRQRGSKARSRPVASRRRARRQSERVTRKGDRWNIPRLPGTTQYQGYRQRTLQRGPKGKPRERVDTYLDAPRSRPRRPDAKGRLSEKRHR